MSFHEEEKILYFLIQKIRFRQIPVLRHVQEGRGSIKKKEFLEKVLACRGGWEEVLNFEGRALRCLEKVLP